MHCYIPPLLEEPKDDWFCLFCKKDILQLPHTIVKGGGLSERDLTLCRRFLLEMYNIWPDSVVFSQCAPLHCPPHMDQVEVQDRIALDVIRGRLDEDNPEHYSYVKDFLADLRKMFRNCFMYCPAGADVYQKAKNLEKRLDETLKVWLPEYAFEPLPDPLKRSMSPVAGPSAKKPKLEEMRDAKKRRKKPKRRSSEAYSDVESDMSEGERTELELLDAIRLSNQDGGADQDPNDFDYSPSSSNGSSGRGRGRPRGRGKRVL